MVDAASRRSEASAATAERLKPALRKFAMQAIRHGTWLAAIDDAAAEIAALVSRETSAPAEILTPPAAAEG